MRILINTILGDFTMIIQSIIEFLMVVLAIIGLIYEPEIAKWEQKLFASIKKKFNERRALSRREKFVLISNDYR